MFTELNQLFNRNKYNKHIKYLKFKILKFYI